MTAQSRGGSESAGRAATRSSSILIYVLCRCIKSGFLNIYSQFNEVMYPSLHISLAAVIIGSVTSRSKCNKINGKTAQDIGVKGEPCGWGVFVFFPVPLDM